MLTPVPTPTEIELRQQERLLHVCFDDGAIFDLPCEYLRVYSPSAENRPHVPGNRQGAGLTGKERVAITEITPVGSYAVKLVFDDGHDTGVYSWETLHRLGREQAQNWATYLQQLQQQGYQRLTEGEAAADNNQTRQQKGAVTLKLIYFVGLVKLLGVQEETLYAPPTVKNVQKMLAYLRGRGGNWAAALTRERVQVTVNRAFAEWETPLQEGDEVGIVPKP